MSSESLLERSVGAVGAATPWVARGAWILVAVLGGAAIESAVDGRSGSVAWTVAIGAWTLWAVVALALAITSTVSLTIVRTLMPLGLAATAAAGIAGAPASDLLVLGVTSAIGVLAATSAEFGRRFVQSSAYGDEERFPLRMPAAAGAAAIVSWLVWAPLLLSGPVLIAVGSWIIGVAVTALALAGTAFLGPRWHRMSLRWFVLVPAGVVVRDPVVLADTLPLRTAQVAGLRLAPASTEAADLTGPASGYAIEVATTETVTAVFAFTPQDPNGRAIHLRSFLVAPSRPGHALRAAHARGLPVT